MPIVDGLTSTKMIRSFEKSHPGSALSSRAALNGRIPILAVSASLLEKERQRYIDAGFDGWILKPIDFQRMAVLLRAIVQEKTRESCLYQPGEWERGGWFAQLQPDVFNAFTAPSSSAPVSSSTMEAAPPQDPKRPIDREQDRLESLGDDAVHAKSAPADPGQSGNPEKATLEGAAKLPEGGAP